MRGQCSVLQLRQHRKVGPVHEQISTLHNRTWRLERTVFPALKTQRVSSAQLFQPGEVHAAVCACGEIRLACGPLGGNSDLVYIDYSGPCFKAVATRDLQRA